MKNHLPKFSPRTQKYPWEKWTDGAWHQLRAGRDFDSTLEIFRTTVLQRARFVGKKAETRKVSEICLAVRFTTKKGK